MPPSPIKRQRCGCRQKHDRDANSGSRRKRPLRCGRAYLHRAYLIEKHKQSVKVERGIRAAYSLSGTDCLGCVCNTLTRCKSGGFPRPFADLLRSREYKIVLRVFGVGIALFVSKGSGSKCKHLLYRDVLVPAEGAVIKALHYFACLG